jgi:hypothetical protein
MTADAARLHLNRTTLLSSLLPALLPLFPAEGPSTPAVLSSRDHPRGEGTQEVDIKSGPTYVCPTWPELEAMVAAQGIGESGSQLRLTLDAAMTLSPETCWEVMDDPGACDPNSLLPRVWGQPPCPPRTVPSDLCAPLERPGDDARREAPRDGGAAPLSCTRRAPASPRTPLVHTC